MKNSIKKVIATTLCMIMMLGIAPLNGFVGLKFPEIHLPDFGSIFETTAKAKDVYTTSGTCGSNVSWTLDEEGTFTVTGNGSFYKYPASQTSFHGDDGPWDNYSIKKIIITQGITDIGQYTFWGCSNLESVSIADSVTSIGQRAFSSCTGLTSITIPNSVTSIGYSAFEKVFNIYYTGTANGSPWDAKAVNGYIDGNIVYNNVSETNLLGCRMSATGNIIIPDSVTSIGRSAFEDCTGLTSITIPDSVTSIGNSAFYECTGLTSITIPDSVTSIGNDAFYKVLNISYNGTANGSPWGARAVNGHVDGYLVFENSSKINLLACSKSADGNILIPDSVTSIGNSAFQDCTGLTSITIPDGVTSIGNRAFNGCYKLTEVIIPESLEEMGSCVFGGCLALKSIEYNAINCTLEPEGSYYINPFWLCLTETITIGKNVERIPNYMLGGIITINGSKVDVNLLNHNSSINSGALSARCLTESDTINELAKWNEIFMEYPALVTELFGIDLSGFEEVTFAEANIINKQCGDNLYWDYDEDTFTLTITGTGDMYGYSSTNEAPWSSFKESIKTVEISNEATSIGAYAFCGCTGLTSMSIPDGVASIGRSAFDGCTGLTNVAIGKGVSVISSYAFKDCSALKSVTIPGNVNCISIQAFMRCTGLENVIIEDGVKTISWWAFGGTAIKKINIPKSVELIEYNPFIGCSLLETITVSNENAVYHSDGNCIIDTNQKAVISGCQNSVIPDDGSVTRINRHAFYALESLSEITLPKSIISIEQEAFDDCINLATVYYNGTATDRGLINIGDKNSPLINATWIYHSHMWDEGNITKTATCKEEGSIVYTCQSCGYSYTETIPKTDDHDWQKFTITASCTQDGGDLYVCSICDHSRLENAVPALGHDYVAKVTPATCEADGFTTHTCSRCGVSYTDGETPALSHNYEPFEVRTSCIQDGCTISICSNCGRSTKSDITPATGHTFGNWTVIRNANENEEGLEQRRCTKCGYTEDRLIPMLERTTFYATFVADGKTVATVEFLKGATSIEEPAVPHKDRYEGKWSAYTLSNADITINAEYTLIDLDTVSGIESGKTATYNSATGEAKINIFAASEGKTVVSTTSEKVPLDIILVVDQSGSMADKLGGNKTKQQALKTASTDFVNSVYADAKTNGVGHRIAIVGFGMGNQSAQGYSAYQNTEILTTGGNPIQYNNATAQNYANALVNVNDGGKLNASITTAINNIDAKGATAADYGLSMANSIFANTDGEGRQRIVVFMTDGAPTYKSEFSKDVANAAVLQANQLKNTYGATVYSVGVMSASESANSDIDTFMNYVSSNYIDAENIVRNYTKQNDSFYISVNNTNALSEVFTEIVTENITRTTDFDNLTVIDTISKYFTLTEKQERDLRIAAIETYGVKNSDITVTRNDDGTTTVIIKNLHPVDDGTKFSVNLSFKVSADEDALKAGTYATNTEDAGLIIGDAENYECVFNTPSITIPADRTLSVFKINGEVYALLNADSANIPKTDFIGEYEFTGWNPDAGTEIAESVTEYNAVYVSKQDYVLIWNTDEGTQRLTVTPGDIIDEPAPAPDNAGNTFRRWNGEVPVTMPADNLEFTAVYGDHEHNYDAEIITPVTCLTDGSTKYTCSICGHTYTETIACPGEHKWIAVTGSANTETGYEEFECEVCGEHCERTLEYKVTGTDEISNGVYNSITTELNYVNANGNNTQPEGNVNIVVPVSDYFEGAEEVDVYRVDGDGNRTECESDYSYGILSFFTNHFSTYEFVATYTETCIHKDENNDGSCDLCGDPMKYTKEIIVDGNKIGEVTFTYGDTKINNLPEVPAKTGYTGEWDYTITGSELDIKAKYTPITYYATFMAEGKQVAKIPFTVETASITAPTVPAKEGYTGKWSEYTLAASDITVQAAYTKIDTPEPPTPTYKLPKFGEKSAAYNTIVTVNVTLTDVPSGVEVRIDGKPAQISGNTYSADIGQVSSTKDVKVEVKYGTKVLDSTTLTVKVDTGFFAKLVSFFSNFLFNMFSWKKVNVNF